MTYDQHIASDPEISVWVSANAGTGKTKVLTDRVLRLLLSGSAPSKILCITYTKAAAAEVEHRIEEQLGFWAIAGDKELYDALKSLTGKDPDTKNIARARKLFALVLDAPERIRIETIHGFCQSVLKRFPLEAGVPPHFTVIDNHTAAELLSEARARLFSVSGNNDATSAVEYFAATISESALNDLIANIIETRVRFMLWFERPEGAAVLIQHMQKRLGVDAGATPEALFDTYFRYTAEELQTLRSACAVLGQGTGDSDKRTFEALQPWLESGQALHRIEPYLPGFLTRDYEPRKLLCTQSTAKHLPGLKEILLAEQGRVAAFVAELKSLKVMQATAHVIRLAESLLAIYSSLKDLHGYMDFDDIIVRTVNLLKQNNAASWVLYKLDGGIDHLLVDEAQDTSPRQWDLVDMLTTEFFSGMGAREIQRTLFIVGDGKQSIYSFQGAEPQSFADMQSKLRRRIELSGAQFRNVQLALSFRSTEPVLKAVDAVFASQVVRDGLMFDENAITHSAYRKGMAGRVEVWPLTETGAPDDLPVWQAAERQFTIQRPETALANTIAEQIKSWFRQKRTIVSQDRLLQPGDILILVQRRGLFASAMLRTLKRHDIPVAGADRLILTEHIAVADCIALANFLLLPEDDLTLATVLKSPFIGLAEEDLFELAYNRGELTLWQRLKDNSKFSAAHDYLSGLLAKVDFMPPYELFSHILDTLGGRRKLAERLGTESFDPVNEFLALALQYDELHVPSLQGFLHWLESGVSEVKRDMEKGRDEVRIMTVHGAKGLQAPVVFLPDTTRMPRTETGMLWTDGAEEMPLWTPSVSDEDVHCRNERERLKLEHEREYRRLLYVAMTRAEDELYICGWKTSRGVSEKCWYELIKLGIDDTWKEMDGRFVLSSEQKTPPKTKPVSQSERLEVELPVWVNEAPVAESVLARPLAPSRMEEKTAVLSPVKDQKARLKGVLIHRLLQYVPDAAPEKRAETLQRFMDKYANAFSKDEQADMAGELLAILEHPDFSAFFSAESVAEAPVTGIVPDPEGNARVVSGQIDRLTILEDKVYIIDYKTGVHVPESEAEVPKAYIRQMAAYKHLIAGIYPDKAVHCALLWTTKPKLMLLEDM